MRNIKSSEVFCDSLSCTYSPDDESERSPVSEIVEFLHGYLNITSEYQKGRIQLRLLQCPPGGTPHLTTGNCFIEERKKFTRIELSGRMLSELRQRGILRDALMVLGKYPHHVTRLDATKDYYCDASPVIKRLWRKHPKSLNLTRKAQKTSVYLGTRFDGKISGSFYVGERTKSRVKALVYDKQHERYGKGEAIGATTRYEMKFTGKDYGMTLKDAENPTEIFWAHSQPLGIKPDVSLQGWEPFGHFSSWESTPHQPASDWDQMIKLENYSGDVKRYLELVRRNGHLGQQRLIRNITETLVFDERSSPTGQEVEEIIM